MPFRKKLQERRCRTMAEQKMAGQKTAKMASGAANGAD